MPFTYAAFKKTESDPKAEIFRLTDHNMLPAMVLWLALTLDVGGQYSDPDDPAQPNPGLDEAKFKALAAGMGFTANTATEMLKLRNGSVPLKTDQGMASIQDVFAATAAIFATQIALHGEGADAYEGPYCPMTLSGLERLAKLDELRNGLADPGQGTQPIPH